MLSCHGVHGKGRNERSRLTTPTHQMPVTGASAALEIRQFLEDWQWDANPMEEMMGACTKRGGQKSQKQASGTPCGTFPSRGNSRKFPTLATFRSFEMHFHRSLLSTCICCLFLAFKCATNFQALIPPPIEPIEVIYSIGGTLRVQSRINMMSVCLWSGARAARTARMKRAQGVAPRKFP